MFLRPGCLVLLVVPAMFGAAPEVDSAKLPRVPATPPEQALATFKIKPGFRLELVAAEPLVIDPIALSFDENGRLYVVEMRDYSEGRPERMGRIRLLEDTDGDGRFDKGTVFAEGLPWPTAVTCWAGGIFVGATPDILWMRDTNGDGGADEREIIFTGFAADYAPFATNKLNVQALMNSFQWTLENRIHGATSFSGGKVKLNDSPFVRAWLKRTGASPSQLSPFNTQLDLRGRDFSFDPRTLEMRAESGGGQHGMSFDDRGRKFVCSNSKHIQMLMYEERYAARSPHYSMPTALIDIAVDGGAAPVFRISPDEPWRVIRTQWRVAGFAPGPIEGGGRASGYFTGATGVTIYRGDAYGPEFVGDAFIGDAGGNLVHRKKLRPDGVGLRAERPADEQNVEFLASTDNWFRPVQFANAPDGCLYIADMYREVIEHPWSLPDSIKKHLDLNSGNDRGRIYRIVPEKLHPRSPSRLSKASTAELVKLLEHPNGWHRDTAARLLYERQDRRATADLQKLVRKASTPQGRLHALYAMTGMDTLTPELVEESLKDTDSTVRLHAVRLAEGFLHLSNAPASLVRRVETMAADTNAVVLFQVALTMADLPKAARVRAVSQVLRHDNGDPWIRRAVLSSVGDAAVELFGELASRQFRAPQMEEFVPALAGIIGARRVKEEAAVFLSNLPGPAATWLSLAALGGFAEGTERAGGTLAKEVPPNQLDEFFSAAREQATNAFLENEGAQSAALRLLGFAPYATAAPTLLALLQPFQSAEIRASALTALGRYPGAKPVEGLLQRWPTFSPSLRNATLDLLLKRPERIRLLLESIERGALRSSDLSAAQHAQLRSHRDPAIREKATEVLGRPPTDTRQAVVEKFLPALQLAGEASRGQKTFQTRCATCHKLVNAGFALGPDLVTVKNGGREKLLANILDPNREVNSNFLSYLVETKDGDSYVGIITTENAAGVTVRMAGGMEQVIARGNIATMQSQGRSLMPEGLEEGLSQQDMADLLEFILAQ